MIESTVVHNLKRTEGPSADLVRAVLYLVAVVLVLGGGALLFHRSNVPYVLHYSKPYLVMLVAYFAILTTVVVAGRFGSRSLASALARPAIRGSVVLLVSGSMTLGAAETVLAVIPVRFWHPDPQHREGAIFARPDPLLHHIRPAGSIASIVSPYGEYRTEVRINSDGLRDVERPIAKPPGTYRILILGDSLTEAAQVPLEQTYAKRLEQALARSLRQPVDVINAGIAAGSPTTEYLMLIHKGMKYEPDLVVCAFSLIAVGQDWEYRNELKFDVQGAPVERTRTSKGIANDVFYSLYAYSRVMQILVGNYFRATRPALPSLMVSIFDDEDTPLETQAWNLTLNTIRAMKRYSETRGAKFVLTAIPLSTQVDSEAGTGSERQVRLPDILRTSRRPQQVLERFSRENRVAYLDLLPDLLSARKEEPLFFRYDTHLTGAGHEVIARALARFLRMSDAR